MGTVSFRGLWRAIISARGETPQWQPALVVDGINDLWRKFFHQESTNNGPVGQAAALHTTGDPGVEEGVYRIIGFVAAITALGAGTKMWISIVDESDNAVFSIFRAINAAGESAQWDYTLYLPKGYEIIMRSDATIAGENFWSNLTVLRLMAA